MSGREVLKVGANPEYKSIQVEDGQVFQIDANGVGRLCGAGIIVLRKGDDLFIKFSDGTVMTLVDFFASSDVEAVVANEMGEEVSITAQTIGQTLSDGRALIYAAGDSATLLDMAQGKGNAALFQALEQGSYDVCGETEELGFALLPLIGGGLIGIGLLAVGAGGGSADPAAPVAPAAPSVTIADADGDGMPEVTGTAEPGSTVTLTWPDGTTSTAVADSNGDYTAEAPSVQPDGDVTAVATDINGNDS
ncbi:Ig-like domain-containing protein, partial [Celeribacter neptunius]